MKKFTVKLTLNPNRNEYMLPHQTDGLCADALNTHWQLARRLPQTLWISVGNRPEPNSFPVKFEGRLVHIDFRQHYLLDLVRATLRAHHVKLYTQYHVALWEEE